MISLMQHGCPPQAIVATYNHDERTVYSWLDRGGEHSKQAHEDKVEQNQIDIKHVQADELCVTTVRLPADDVIQKQEQALQQTDESIQSHKKIRERKSK